MPTQDKARKKKGMAPAMMWLTMVHAQAQQSKVVRKQKADAEISDQIRNWSSDLFRQVLRTSTEFSASLSLPVVLSLIEIARADAIKTAAELREKAMEDRFSSARAKSQARTHFTYMKGNLSQSAGPVQETIKDISKAIVWEWSADVRERLAVTLESVASSMFTSIEGGLRQANGRIHAMMTPQDGQPPAIASWPRNTNEVPSTFAPSPVEFYLEDYTTWPQRAKELISSSLENREGLPIDPVEAARTLIIRGEYGGSDNGHAVRPFIWGEGHGTEPEWEAGRYASIVVDDSMAGLGDRIDAWLTRPATDLHRFLSEGLGAYLSTNDPLSKAPIEDHHERLHAFGNHLQFALLTSRPFIEVNQTMNAEVHPMELDYSLNIQGFPFGVGHPARQITEQIIQGFLNTSEPVDWAFTSAELESVLISGFLNYPVNPSVITSFTKPLADSVTNFFNTNHVQSAFWNWRRAQTLSKFIPLPSELLLAMIRGFAVARALGVMSRETQNQNVVADHDGDKLFPKYLLTPVDGNNLLPGLLEAMVLTFAEATAGSEHAFGAYGTLIEYGTNELGVGDFAVGGLLRHYLEFGDHNGVRIVDQDRANAVRGDNLSGRAERICEYLQRNIERFDDLERIVPDERSWRNSYGTVEPVDTLTFEILPQLQMAYKEVLDAVRHFHERSLKSDF